MKLVDGEKVDQKRGKFNHTLSRKKGSTVVKKEVQYLQGVHDTPPPNMESWWSEYFKLKGLVAGRSL